MNLPTITVQSSDKTQWVLVNKYFNIELVSNLCIQETVSEKVLSLGLNIEDCKNIKESSGTIM